MLEKVESATTDKEIFDAVSEVVTHPKSSRPGHDDDSFILHAPLEICARYFLMPLVSDRNKDQAREQMKNVARKYNDCVDVERQVAPHLRDNHEEVVSWASSFGFAGHTTILLALARLLVETNESIELVLDIMSSGIAHSSFEKMKIDVSSVEPSEEVLDPKNIVSFFMENVANPPTVTGDTDTIRAVVQTPENAGVIEPVIRSLASLEVTQVDISYHLFPLITRIAALSMICEDESESKFGWTHCLTIPHSHWVLTENFAHEKELFLTAATYLTSYRAVAGKTAIVSPMFSDFFDEDEDSVFASHHEEMSDVISQACILEDAHLVKYVYSCFDIMKRDPNYASLYIAAAKRLLKIWQDS